MPLNNFVFIVHSLFIVVWFTADLSGIFNSWPHRCVLTSARPSFDYWFPRLSCISCRATGLSRRLWEWTTDRRLMLLLILLQKEHFMHFLWHFPNRTNGTEGTDRKHVWYCGVPATLSSKISWGMMYHLGRIHWQNCHHLKRKKEILSRGSASLSSP